MHRFLVHGDYPRLNLGLNLLSTEKPVRDHVYTYVVIYETCCVDLAHALGS